MSNKVSHNRMNKSAKNSGGKNTYKKHQNDQILNRWFLLPIILVIAVIPLIVKIKDYNTNLSQYDWFPDKDSLTDVFLYYKQWFFVTIAGIMVFIIVWKVRISNKMLCYNKVFIPLMIYAVLALLSSLFSNNLLISFTGGPEQFESVLALLGYCIVAYYAFLFVNTEKSIEYILKYFTISTLILCAIGLSQFFKHDFFASDIGKRMITDSSQWNNLDGIDFVFEKGRVYLTLFNPNYVGVYVSLIAPIFFVLLIFSKKVVSSIFYSVALIGLMITQIGSKSAAGYIGLGCAVLGLMLFLWRYIIKKYYFTIPIMIVVVISLFYVNDKFDVVSQITRKIKTDKVEVNLSDIKLDEEKVSVTYKGNVINFSYLTEDNMQYIIAVDDTGNLIENIYQPDSGTFAIQDERFPGFLYQLIQYDDYTGMSVKIDGRDWYFTNQTEDGSYHFINRFGKIDTIVKAPSAIFTGYERFASSRGYIWSRTIPLMKKHILLGSGADTFILAFPQNDYVSLVNYSFYGEFVSKPHSLYLQMAIQTGLLSLLAFLAFYGMYFVSSIKLYIRGRFNNYYAQVGVAIFIGTIGYMITGITNDSSITVAPIFWVLMGMGIAVNLKAKTLILEERTAIKEAQ